MIQPNKIYTFLVVEYLTDNGYKPISIDMTEYGFKKENQEIRFDKTLDSLETEKVAAILEQAGFTFAEFQEYCEYFMKSKDFETSIYKELFKKE